MYVVKPEMGSNGEASLLGGQEFAEAVFNQSGCVIVAVDKQGIILKVNKACELISGFTEAELVGKSYIDVLVPEELKDRARAGLERLAITKITSKIESRWKRKDGSNLLLEGSSSVMTDASGEVAYILGIGIDVTKEREAQEALRTSQERLALAIKSSQDGIWEVDVVNNEHYYSPRWKEIIGYKDEELQNDRATWFSRIHPDDLEAVRRYQGEFNQHPEMRHEVEFRMRHKDGSWRYILSRGIAIYEDGKPLRIVGCHKDITLRKLQEHALRESEAGLLDALEIANLGQWEFDLSNKSIRWTPQTYKIYGIDPDHRPLTAEELLNTVHPDDRENVRLSIKQAEETGEPYRVKRRIYRPDGELRHIVANARVVLDSEGHPVRVVGVVQDVTEQQIAEEAIHKVREQALEASRLKSEFLANMSHEIRTPMNGVIGMADLLLDTSLDQQQKEYANTIRSSADGLMSILNDILDFSKIEAGKMEIEVAEFDVLQVVEDVASLFGKVCWENGVSVVIDAEWGQPARYLGDGRRLRQILINLTSNAHKFTSAGSITLGLRTSDEGVHLWVADTGSGISPDRHHAIFESFTQADGSTTRRYGGTGLGLAIVKQLTELMGGDVALTSEQEKGSRFDVVFPLERATSELPTLPLANQSVLLVAEQQQLIDSIRTCFEQLGAAVDAVQNTNDAVVRIQCNQFNTVLVGPRIERSGWANLQKALGDSGGNIVLITHENASAPAGFDAVLSLPLTRNSIASALLSSINGSTSPSLAKTTTFSGLRVLLAEDNQVNQTVAVHQLDRMGFTVDTATNGLQAVELVRKNRYDLVLMDVQMPQMDGLAATRAIRADESLEYRPTILAMTAHAMQGDRERCLDAGMDDYISKPVRPQELLEKLIDWLDPAKLSASGIEWDYLHDLSENDPQFEREILEVYLKTTPQLMQGLVDAIRTHSFQVAIRLAHTLHGSSRSIGANQFGDLCQEIESLAEQSQAYRHVDRLERQYAELIEECQNFVTRGAE